MSSAMDSDSVNLGSNPSSPANKTCEDYGVLCVQPVLLDRSEPTKKANNAKRAPTKAGHKSVVGSFPMDSVKPLCPHDREHCLRCHEQRYEDTCWFCAGVMKTEGVIVGVRPVHKRCKAKARQYLIDVG